MLRVDGTSTPRVTTRAPTLYPLLVSDSEQFEDEEWARRLGLGHDDVIPFGRDIFKITRRPHRAKQSATYIAVTAVTPTPLGEGKTVTTIGLSMALNALGTRAIATLRQPSLAPVLGIKGGGAGGGKSRLEPFDRINLGLSGDLFAVEAANNLLAAVIDDHMYRAREPQLDPGAVSWKRVMDIGDRSLVDITTNLAGKSGAATRNTGFELTAASEVMAILALASGISDLKARLKRIVVGRTPTGTPVTAAELGVAGAMAMLLRDAVYPNLVRTSSGSPALVHAGPFANIAHGNCSVVADLLADELADVVVTEGGFGSDMGAEKLFHIKCRASGLRPDAAVLVCTLRALKLHSGHFDVKPGKPLPPELAAPNAAALEAGVSNLHAHIDILKAFGLPVVVAINRFPEDTQDELDHVRRVAQQLGAHGAAVSEVFARGAEGGRELATMVLDAARKPNEFRMLYELSDGLESKLTTLATRLYGARRVELSSEAKEHLDRFTAEGYGALPVCVAKTQASLSHDPKLLGRPRDYDFAIRDVRLSAGAGFVYALAGTQRTMPGLPGDPSAKHLDLADDGSIIGLR
ncbi:MAG: formate--tetrahydrofolate ligase [Polyangiaceae bacterium]